MVLNSVNESAESSFNPVIIIVIAVIVVVIIAAVLLIIYGKNRTLKHMNERVSELKEAEEHLTVNIIEYQKLYFKTLDTLKTILPDEAESLFETCNPNQNISEMTIDEKEETLSLITYGMNTLHSLLHFYDELNENEKYSSLVDDGTYQMSLIDGAKSIYNSKVYSYNKYLLSWPMISLASRYNFKKINIFEFKEYKRQTISLDTDDDEDELIEEAEVA